MRPLTPFGDKHSWFYPPYGYDELLASMEFEVLGQTEHGDYQGDTQALVRDGDRYGYLLFGWGSCSGCDALQDCSSVAEATELRDSIAEGIHWFDSAADLRKYLGDRDWALQWLGEEMGAAIVALAQKALA